MKFKILTVTLIAVAPLFGQVNKPAVQAGQEEKAEPPAGQDATSTVPIEPEVEIKAPIESREDLQAFEFSIPAPRGLITDRRGKPLAQTVAVPHLALFLPALADDKTVPLGRVSQILTGLEKIEGLELNKPTDSQITQHWEHRRLLPLIITGADSDVELVRKLAEESDHLTTEIRYARRYSGGEAFAHITGYVRPEMPEQYGPLKRDALKWPAQIAEAGLEESFDEALKGQRGNANFLIDPAGKIVNREFASYPRPGATVVTTLDHEMQKLGYDLLEETERPGAFVAVDSLTGDVLALVSYPSFDAQDFVDGISEPEYAALRDHKDAPLFNRAYQGAYPPGSTFKPFVGIAALNSGAVLGTSTRFQSPPYLEIDGRRFHNWNDEHEGILDIRYAIMRSSNTWFYQAGIYTGSRPIIESAQVFGFGEKPDIPLANVAAGNLPDAEKFMVRQGIANLSIGQGDVLVSPLQLASAMNGFSYGEYAARPHLIMQVQTAFENEPTEVVQPEKQFFNFRRSDLKTIRDGMWAVVNHQRGTGKAAAYHWPEIYGKTGTSQWSKGGKEHPLVWFTGFAGTGTPRISFAVMLQGEPGEVIYGGKNAAPVAGEFFKQVYADPEKFGVKFTPRKADPSLTRMTETTPPPENTQQAVARAVEENRVISDQEVQQLVNAKRYSTRDTVVRARPIKRVTPEPREDKERASIFKRIFD